MAARHEEPTPLDTVTATARQCLSTMPVIVLGSGASIAHGLPSTTELTCLLRDQPIDPQWSSDEQRAWQDLLDRIELDDLEEALGRQNLPESVQDYIVQVVWSFVQERDCEAFDQLVNSISKTPLAQLYSFLLATSEREISVVTTNYDRIAEYSADIANRWCYSGFPPGYFRQRHADIPYKIALPRTAGQATELKKINVWKVHGSLDWFLRPDGDVVSVMAARKIPTHCRPAIITPGLHKYEQTHQDPFRSVLSGADRALDSAGAYLCIGYGFNDRHIHPRLLNRWRSGDALLLILARHLTPQAREMLADPRDGRFLALECSSGSHSGTHIISNLSEPISDIDDVNLWDLGDFMDHIAPTRRASP